MGCSEKEFIEECNIIRIVKMMSRAIKTIIKKLILSAIHRNIADIAEILSIAAEFYVFFVTCNFQ